MGLRENLGDVLVVTVQHVYKEGRSTYFDLYSVVTIIEKSIESKEYTFFFEVKTLRNLLQSNILIIPKI